MMGALDDIMASLTADAKSFAMRKVVDYVAADPHRTSAASAHRHRQARC